MSNYLKGVLDGYSLPATLPTGLGELASAIVDGYIRRPEGLVYVADNNGNPCAMAGMSPTITYTITGAVAPGTNVAITISPANARVDMIGEVLVLDYASANLVEACVVTGVTSSSQIVLGTVQFSHASSCKADVGRVITEDRSCPSKRSMIRVAKWPIMNLLSLMGRYAYGRRSDQIAGAFQEMNLLATIQAFGGPPAWTPISTAQASYSDQTGEIWVPSGMLMAYYSDVRAKYVAGYPEAPQPVVKATAQIAGTILSTAGMPASIKTITAGDTKLESFSSSTLDDDVKSFLQPYRARTMY